MDGPRRRVPRLALLLSSPRVPFLAAAIAVALTLPAIGTGWHVDDLYHRAQFLEIGPLSDSSNMTNRMFDFLSGDPEQILAFKELGVVPWWANDRLKISFWRPLSALTHVIDYALWPQSGVLMHLHSVAWLGLLVFFAAFWYRRTMGPSYVAGLAVVLFALDDAHGLPAGFLANRNAIVATSLGVLSLWMHDRARRDGFRPGLLLSPLAFACALLSGESGIGTAAYLFAYAVCLEPGPVLRRLSTIAPHGLVGLGWLVLYETMGYGTAGSEFYLDPMGQPLAWLGAFLVRAPLLLLGQWFVPPSSFVLLWTPAQTVGVAVFGVSVLAVLFALLRPILREEPTARFFGLGMTLAVVPITAGYPNDRLLFFVGLGAMGLLAMLLVRLFDRNSVTTVDRLVGWALVVVHVVLAAPLQVMMSASMASQEPFYAAAPRSLPDDTQLTSQRLIVVNQPSFFYGQYLLLVRAMDSRPAPESLLLMAPGTSGLTVERVSIDEILIEAEDGYLRGPFDNVYRASHGFPEDYRLDLSDVRVEVISLTEDRRPRRVRFTFAVPLEDPSLRWVLFEDGRYVPFAVPPVGGLVNIEPVELNLLSPPAYEEGP